MLTACFFFFGLDFSAEKDVWWWMLEGPCLGMKKTGGSGWFAGVTCGEADLSLFVFHILPDQINLLLLPVGFWPEKGSVCR
jgi:hypothetical protein